MHLPRVDMQETYLAVCTEYAMICNSAGDIAHSQVRILTKHVGNVLMEQASGYPIILNNINVDRKGRDRYHG